MENNVNDVLVIGAGPSGLSAAIYLIRAGYDVTIFEEAVPGGKVNTTAHVENYPGYTSITGPDLAYKLYEHALSFGAKIKSKSVLSLRLTDDGLYEVQTKKETLLYRAVIIATGSKEKQLDAEDALNYENKGISYCAVCDGRFYQDKPVAVVGGGDSALEEALYLEKICSEVYLIHRRDAFRASKSLEDKVRASSIKLVLDSIVTKVTGENKVEGVDIKNVKTNETSSLKVDGLFPFVGALPNTTFVEIKDILDERGYIKVNNEMETIHPGLFACGDVIVKNLRQIVTAASDGALAAISASNYLKK